MIVVVVSASSASLTTRFAWLFILVALLANLAFTVATSDRTAKLQRALAQHSKSGTVSSTSATATPEGRSAAEVASRERIRLAAERINEISTTSPNMSARAALPQIPETDKRDEGPLVTVIIPCYNDSRYLSTCLDSLLAQSFERWIAIVVDDASTDGSLTVAARYARRDTRITVRRHYANSGLPSSRNTGLHATTTRYVTFLDSDDFLFQDSLEDRIDAISRAFDPLVAGVFCGIKPVPDSAELNDYPPHLSWKPAKFHDFVSTRGECPFNAHAPMLYTDIVKSFGGFDESMLNGAEDWDLWRRIMRSGYYFTPSQHVTAAYRQKPASMVRSMPAQHLKEAARLLSTALEPVSIESVGGPCIFTEPMSDYQSALRLAKRVCSYLGLAAMTNDNDQVEAALDLLPDNLPYGVLIRHVDIASIITTSIGRAVGLERQELASLDAGITGMVESLISQIEKKLSAAISTEMVATCVDLVMFPTDAGQAKEMVSALAKNPQATETVFITSSRLDGDQGADAYLRNAGVAFQSYTSFALSSPLVKALVTMYPHANTTASMIADATAAGTKTIDLAPSLWSVPMLECHQGSETDTIADLATLSLHEHSDHGAGQLKTRATTPLFSAEEYPNTKFDPSEIRHWENAHRGERVFIIGNGPSLNEIDLTKLQGESTIAVNGIFYASEKMGFDPTFYVVEDTSVMKENLDSIKEFKAGHKFFPTIYRDMHGEGENVSFFMMNRGFYEKSSPNYCVPRFSTNAASSLFAGQSVTIINLQLAYYMGFSEVVLIGMDFSYTIPDSASRNGDVLTSAEDDPNHFHPDYFGKGKTWKDPKLDRVLANYSLAKRVYEADGRRIVNATPGGKLELFDRVKYETLFEGSQSEEQRR